MGILWLRKHHVISSGGNIKLGPKLLAPFDFKYNYCNFFNFTNNSNVNSASLRKGYKMNPISSCGSQLGKYIKLGNSLSDLDQYTPKTLHDWSRNVEEPLIFCFWDVFFAFRKQLCFRTWFKSSGPRKFLPLAEASVSTKSYTELAWYFYANYKANLSNRPWALPGHRCLR